MTIVIECPTCTSEILCGVESKHMPGNRGVQWDGYMAKSCVCPTPTEDEIEIAVERQFIGGQVRE